MKILIIGQAPPAQVQQHPYDTTLLYDIFGWVGVSKDEAQTIFEFEAMTDKFPGHTKSGGHALPGKMEMWRYYNDVLLPKIENCKAVIVLGRHAETFLKKFGIESYHKPLYMIHPSRRNYSKIMAQKEELITKLKEVL